MLLAYDQDGPSGRNAAGLSSIGAEKNLMMNKPIPEVVTITAGAEIEAQPSQIPPAVEAQLTESRQEFLRFLVRRLGDRDTAEDVLQQFYLRVVSRGHELRKTQSVFAWLYTVLRTTLIDHYRKEATRRNRDTEYALMQTVTDECRDAEPKDGVCECVSTVIPTLKPEYSDVLQRIDLSETPSRKVADSLGITTANLRVRLHRARQALKRALLVRCGRCAENGCRDCSCNHSAGQPKTVETYRPIAA